LGEFDNSLLEFHEILKTKKLDFLLPHQGSELFTKCRNGADCLPGVGYLLAGWFSWANERSRRFERFKVFGDLHYANFGGEAFCKEHLYKVRKFLPCQAKLNRGAFS
jgi:hypothetical protein